MTLEELKVLAEKQTKKTNTHTLAPNYDVTLTLSARGKQYKEKSCVISIYNDHGSRLKTTMYIQPVYDEVTMRIYLLPSTKVDGYKGTQESRATRIKFVNPNMAKLIEENHLDGSYRIEKDNDCGVWFIGLFERYRKYRVSHKK